MQFAWYVHIACLQHTYLVFTGPPSIVNISSETVPLEGRKVILSCYADNNVDADYPVQIQWYTFKGEQIQAVNKRVLITTNSDNYTDETESMLMFDPVNRTDTGTYTCRAYNHPQCYSEGMVRLTVKCEFCCAKKCYHS